MVMVRVGVEEEDRRRKTMIRTRYRSDGLVRLWLRAEVVVQHHQTSVLRRRSAKGTMVPDRIVYGTGATCSTATNTRLLNDPFPP